MTSRDKLNLLSRLIEDARKLATDLDEIMAAYILSIASREVSERIERTEMQQPAEPD
jgi:hypothetical protein